MSVLVVFLEVVHSGKMGQVVYTSTDILKVALINHTEKIANKSFEVWHEKRKECHFCKYEQVFTSDPFNRGCMLSVLRGQRLVSSGSARIKLLCRHCD